MAKNGKLTRSQLSTVAEELNKELDLKANDGISPGIDPKSKKSDLEQKIKEAGDFINLETDELTEDTWWVLGKLEVFASTENSGDGELVEAKEPDPEEVGPQTKNNEGLMERVKGAKKLKELKQIAKEDFGFTDDELKDYTGLPGPNQLREDLLSDLGEEKNAELGNAEPPKDDQVTWIGEASGAQENPIGDNKQEQKAASNSNKAGSAGKPKRFTDDQGIRVLAKENPKRTGTKCQQRFALYKDGMTIKQYVEAGGKREDIRWDSERDYIQVQHGT